MLIYKSQRSLRVLFLLGTLWKGNGITSHLRTLSKQLMKRGFEVAIVSDLPYGLEGAYDKAMQAVESFKRDGVTYFIIPFAKTSAILRQPLKVFKTIQAFEQAIQLFKPDIIHCHSLSVVPYIHILRIRHKISFVSTCHVEPLTSPSTAKLIKLISRFFPTLFGEQFVAISNELKSAFQDSLGVPSTSIHLIYHGVDNDYFRVSEQDQRLDARREYNISPTDKVICLIGRLSPSKGHDILIKALSYLKEEGLAVTALFAGQGYENEEQDIKICASKLGVLDSVRFLGMTDSRQVLWASDVIVLPSRPNTEGFPLVIAEAMSCGVIPIRTPAAGARDQIENGVNGFIIPFDDPQALASRVKQVLENDELRMQMSAATLASARQNFSLDRMIKDTIEVYENVKIEGS